MIGEKRVCQSCLDNFEVGHIGVDRYVIERIHPKFTSHIEAAEWLKSLGVNLKLVNQVGDTYIYHPFNNEEAYNLFMKGIKDEVIKVTDPRDLDSTILLKLQMMVATFILFIKDGEI